MSSSWSAGSNTRAGDSVRTGSSNSRVRGTTDHPWQLVHRPDNDRGGKQYTGGRLQPLPTKPAPALSAVVGGTSEGVAGCLGPSQPVEAHVPDVLHGSVERGYDDVAELGRCVDKAVQLFGQLEQVDAADDVIEQIRRRPAT